jgi:hypothetical protein
MTVVPEAQSIHTFGRVEMDVHPRLTSIVCRYSFGMMAVPGEGLMESNCALVEFHGTQILTIKDGDVIRVAIRPIAEALGLAWQGQYERIKRNPVLAEGVSLELIPSEGGMQETLTLPLDLLHGWLFGISAIRVKEPLRAKVLAFQRECYRVLFDYWHRVTAINPRAERLQQADRSAARRDLMRMIKALRSEPVDAMRRIYHNQIVELCSILGETAPPISAFPYKPRTKAEAMAYYGIRPLSPEEERELREDCLGSYGSDPSRH